MPEAAVRELLALLRDAYDSDPEHSLLGSLWTVSDTDWSAKLTEDGRSIRAIVRHVATAYHAYYDSGFGSGEPSWERMAAIGLAKVERDDLMAWLAEGHQSVIAAVSALTDDAELEAPRPSHWGELVPTRRILTTLIAHAYYHAGEINHLRSVLQGNDRWDYWGDAMPSPGSKTG
jgi:uncharacterized damage-inducible protein DinB